MGINIRAALIDDKEYVQKAIECLLSELRDCQVEIQKKEFELTFLQMIEDKKNYGVFIAELDREIVGVIAISLVTSLHCGKYGIIEELWVLKESRRRGVGKSLIYKAEDYCINNGIRRIEVGLPSISFKDINKTYSFYSKCGFEDVGFRKRRVLDENRRTYT